MSDDKPLINRVAESGLITLKLEDFFPEGEVAVFDLKDYLFMELILKEKDFREALKQHDRKLALLPWGVWLPAGTRVTKGESLFPRR